VAHLDAARTLQRLAGHGLGGFVAQLVGGGVILRQLLDEGVERLRVVGINGQVAGVAPAVVEEHLALAAVREHHELVAEVAADGPVGARIGMACRPMRWKGAQVAQHHALVAVAAAASSRSKL
jgi:hypothetical protein